MSNEKEYKGYVIIPAPHQLADTGRWTLDVYVRKNLESEIRERHFSGGNTFESREEAARHCINFGMQIIDGQADNLSVDDL